MNTLFRMNSLNLSGKFKQSSWGKTALFTLPTGLLLMSFSAGVLANRPAMEERVETNNTAENAAAATASDADLAAQLDAEAELQQELQEELQQEAAPRETDTQVEVTVQQQTGDVLQLPTRELRPGETLAVRLLDFPRRGMSMEKVKSEYGQPNTVSGPVGQPPITHWTYNDRVVYFEYSTVLHVVAR